MIYIYIYIYVYIYIYMMYSICMCIIHIPRPSKSCIISAVSEETAFCLCERKFPFLDFYGCFLISTYLWRFVNLTHLLSLSHLSTQCTQAPFQWSPNSRFFSRFESPKKAGSTGTSLLILKATVGSSIVG